MPNHTVEVDIESTDDDVDTPVRRPPAPKPPAPKPPAPKPSAPTPAIEEAKCPVCLVGLGSVEELGELACGHAFCLACITEWAKVVHTCPVDRRPFDKICLRDLVTGDVAIYIDAPPSAPRPEDDDEDDDGVYAEDDVCKQCGIPGQLLLCDSCDFGWHLECVGLAQIPDGSWFCSTCLPEQSLAARHRQACAALNARERGSQPESGRRGQRRSRARREHGPADTELGELGTGLFNDVMASIGQASPSARRPRSDGPTARERERSREQQQRLVLEHRRAVAQLAIEQQRQRERELAAAAANPPSRNLQQDQKDALMARVQQSRSAANPAAASAMLANLLSSAAPPRLPAPLSNSPRPAAAAAAAAAAAPLPPPAPVATTSIPTFLLNPPLPLPLDAPASVLVSPLDNASAGTDNDELADGTSANSSSSHSVARADKIARPLALKLYQTKKIDGRGFKEVMRVSVNKLMQKAGKWDRAAVEKVVGDSYKAYSDYLKSVSR